MKSGRCQVVHNRPNYPSEPKWHPLAYHCLDVAAVADVCSRATPLMYDG